MREILFRGKKIDNGEWEYGFIIKATDSVLNKIKSGEIIRTQYFIFNDSCYAPFEVDPKTVGQYTGLKDKNKKNIFGGDIVMVKDYNRYFNVEVQYVNYGFLPFRSIDEKFAIGSIDPEECEVVGNIYENKELIK